jgi:hypothetical protein
MGTLHEDLCTFMRIYLWILIRMRMFQIKVVEKIKTRILFSIIFFRKSCRLWNNEEKYGRARQATGDSIVRSMRIACWVIKATDTHSEYVILTAFPRQQWLRERASILSYTCFACLFYMLCRSVVSKLCCVQPQRSGKEGIREAFL